MKILITNDDGIQSPGLWALQHAIAPHAETIVAAPSHEQSGRGASISLPGPVETSQLFCYPCEAHSVQGTPADCIRFAFKNLSKPDLVVSGINPGANSGRFLFCSGTVGGAIEAVLRGIPSIAFSCENMHDPQFERFAKYSVPIIRHTSTHPIPPGTLLNVNFPAPKTLETLGLSDVAGIRCTRHARTCGKRASQCEHYWIERGYITVVPIYIGELTNWLYLHKAKTQFESLTLS
jgi:5'-nucleotidase